MTTLVDTLRWARGLVGGGWAEPLCVDADGRFCDREDEGLSRYTLFDAVVVACAGDDELRATVWESLETVAPDGLLWGWLFAAERTQEDVVRLCSRAISRVQTKEAA